ncbi:MAG: hypothetical protein H6746_01010 [Deltaproteobacteria bacterium]|nr:hypothetical protein [Deltaproteobacteria bacterium]
MALPRSRLIPLFVALLSACGGAGGDGLDAGEAGVDVAAEPDDGSAPLDPCPATPPHLERSSTWTCTPAGMTCRFPALGCAPGALPDTVCHCEDGLWRCESHLHSCLPAGPEAAFWAGEARPVPEHRADAATCELVLPADDVRCSRHPPGRRDPAAATCDVDADCPGADARCLESTLSADRTACQCHDSACRSDDDCQSGALCRCGAVDDLAAPCGAAQHAPCLHQCVPAACRVDADCAPGALCSPSRDRCGTITAYACHDPAADECLHDLECGPPDRFACRLRGAHWQCEPRGTCF